MKKLVFFFLLLTSFAVQAQKYDPDKVNSKARKAHEQAWELIRDGQLREAIPHLKKAIEIDKGYLEAISDLAGVYSELKDYPTAISTFELVRDKDTSYFRLYLLQYAYNLAGNGRFQDALNAVNKYSANVTSDRATRLANSRRKSYEFAVEYSKNNSLSNYVFTPENLGDNINSDKLEYLPSITIVDSIFIYTRRSGGREDFMSSMIKNGEFGKANRIEGELNDAPFKGAINISQDGEWLIFAADYGQAGFGGYDLYISYRTPQGWSRAENMGRNINTDAWESTPSLSPDKKALYFSSTRPGGFGGKDLYVSFRTAKGWSVPVNLGAAVNTEGNEEAPFIHADNHTLYFTSDGLPGYGSADNFIMRRDYVTRKWGKPVNLGYPINTIENDGSLYIAADGITAFYASDRADTRGGLDLYKFKMREDVRPAKTLYVKGFVLDAKTRKGLPSSVELIDNSSNTAITKIQTDETGFYFITLPVGHDYTFAVNRQGYLFYSKLYELSKAFPDSTYQNDIPLQPIEIDATVALKNIQFEVKSFNLLPISLVELDKLLQLMTENPLLKVEISGHTDNVGTPADNKKLSENRAKAVADYLVSRGIDAKRLTWKGYGETKPVADNKTEAGRALNRRTEFKIIGM